MGGRRRREHPSRLAAAARRRSCVGGGGGNIMIGGGGARRRVQDSSSLTYFASEKIPTPLNFLTFFPKRLRIFSPNFKRLLSVPIYAGIQIFIQLSATLTKLCHIKRDHPVHIICLKCPPSAEMHAGWSHFIWHNFVTFGDL